jgi:dephospho-CoA kinase
VKIIGLTGGIGTGKSTVGGFLAELGATVLDLDKIGHEVLMPEGGAYGPVVDAFGKGILTRGGEIDRAKLGEIVFKDRRALSRLNGITHPAIDGVLANKINKYRRHGVKVVVLEAGAMVDAGKTAQVEELWVTIAPKDTVVQRLKQRPGLAEVEIITRINAQLPDKERLKIADVVINTDCALEELKNRVKTEWQKLLNRIADE